MLNNKEKFIKLLKTIPTIRKELNRKIFNGTFILLLENGTIYNRVYLEQEGFKNEDEFLGSCIEIFDKEFKNYEIKYKTILLSKPKLEERFLRKYIKKNNIIGEFTPEGLYFIFRNETNPAIVRSLDINDELSFDKQSDTFFEVLVKILTDDYSKYINSNFIK